MSEHAFDARFTDAHLVKDQRINLRTTRRQGALLRRAAETTERTLTDFVLGSAVEHAEPVLADRHWFVASDEQFDAFQRLLDKPLPSTSRFDRLFSRGSQFQDAESSRRHTGPSRSQPTELPDKTEPSHKAESSHKIEP